MYKILTDIHVFEAKTEISTFGRSTQILGAISECTKDCAILDFLTLYPNF